MIGHATCPFTYNKSHVLSVFPTPFSAGFSHSILQSYRQINSYDKMQDSKGSIKLSTCYYVTLSVKNYHTKLFLTYSKCSAYHIYMVQ